MTPQEAIKYLKNWRNAIESRGDEPFSDAVMALTYGIKALEKQIPKKPIIDDPLNDDPEIYYKCPSCGEVHNKIDNPYVRFCPCCSQAIDWSEDE